MTNPAGAENELKILNEILPGDLWKPTSIDEWAAQERLRAFLPAWSAQVADERKLRAHCAWMIFSLAAVQSVGGFGLLIFIGLGKLSLDVGFLKILYSALLAEVFGLFFVVTRFLFRDQTQFSMPGFNDALSFPPGKPGAKAPAPAKR